VAGLGASMGPRSEDRGNGVTWGRQIFRPDGLQWGRDLKIAEIHQRTSDVGQLEHCFNGAAI